MKKLIVSADDFGMTEGINSGIIKSFNEGIVTSASIMANMPGFEPAINLAKGNPHLAIGIHLNIMKGEPLQPANRVSSLVDSDGSFHPLTELIKRLLLGRIVLAEMEQELRSQVEQVIATGLKITHLDSHRHFHIYPSILKVIVRLAGEYNIARIRYPRSRFDFSLNWKELLLLLLSLRSSNIMTKNDMEYPQRFFEFLRIEKNKNPLQSFDSFCRNLPEGVTELCCHPGFVTGELDKSEAGAYNRERQIEILTAPDVLELLQKYDVRLINYAHSFE